MEGEVVEDYIWRANEGKDDVGVTPEKYSMVKWIDEVKSRIGIA